MSKKPLSFLVFLTCMYIVGCEKPPVANIKVFEERRDDPKNKSPKSPVSLCYEVERAIRLEIQPNNVQIDPVNTGCKTVTPDQTTSYTLIAIGEDNKKVEKTITVEVLQPPPIVKSFEVTPQTVDFNQPVNICYQVQNAVAVFLPEYPDAKLELKGDFEGELCSQYSPKYSVNPLILVARNRDGAEVKSEERELTVIPPEEAQVWLFEGSRKSIERGQSARLCFGVSEGSTVSVTNSDIRGVESTDGRPKCGDVRPNVATDYALQATGPNGKIVHHPVVWKIDVTEPKPFADLHPRYGSKITELCYTAKNVSSAQITNEKGWARQALNDGKEHCFQIETDSTHSYVLSGPELDKLPIATRKEEIRVPSIIKFSLKEKPAGIEYEIGDFNTAQIQLENMNEKPYVSPIPLREKKGVRSFLPAGYRGRRIVIKATGSDIRIFRVSNTITFPNN